MLRSKILLERVWKALSWWADKFQHFRKVWKCALPWLNRKMKYCLLFSGPYFFWAGVSTLALQQLASLLGLLDLRDSFISLDQDNWKSSKFFRKINSTLISLDISKMEDTLALWTLWILVTICSWFHGHILICLKMTAFCT